MSDNPAGGTTDLAGPLPIDAAVERLVATQHGGDPGDKRVNRVKQPEDIYVVEAAGRGRIAIDVKTFVRRRNRAERNLLRALSSGEICAKLGLPGSKNHYVIPTWYWCTEEGLWTVGDGLFHPPELEAVYSIFDTLEQNWKGDLVRRRLGSINIGKSVKTEWDGEYVYLDAGDLELWLRGRDTERFDVKKLKRWTFVETVIWIGTRSTEQLAIVHERVMWRGRKRPTAQYAAAILGMVRAPVSYEQSVEELCTASSDGKIGARIRRSDDGQFAISHAESGGAMKWHSPVFAVSDVLRVWPPLPDVEIVGANDGQPSEAIHMEPMQDDEYLSPFIRFMIRATRENGLTESEQSTAESLQQWIRENWNHDHLGAVSKVKVEKMATFMRDPDSGLGRARKRDDVK